MGYERGEDPLVAEQMFLRGCIPQLMGAGVIKQLEDVDTWMSGLSAIWRAHYPHKPMPGFSFAQPNRVVVPGSGISPPPLSKFSPQQAQAPGQEVPPETKPFQVWANDKAYYGKKEWDWNGISWPDVTWAMLYQGALAGDSKAVGALKKMAESPLQPQYKYSGQKIGRAKAVLNLVAQGGAAEEPEYQETPF